MRRRVWFILHELWCELKGDKRSDFEKYVERCRYLHLPDIIHNPSGPREQTPEQVANDRHLVRKLVSQATSSDGLHG
ncbi:MAG: hypothetical protein AAB428_00730 [Patescibacteria group bacterium]